MVPLPRCGERHGKAARGVFKVPLPWPVIENPRISASMSIEQFDGARTGSRCPRVRGSGPARFRRPAGVSSVTTADEGPLSGHTVSGTSKGWDH